MSTITQAYWDTEHKCPVRTEFHVMQKREKNTLVDAEHRANYAASLQYRDEFLTDNGFVIK